MATLNYVTYAHWASEVNAQDPNHVEETLEDVAATAALRQTYAEDKLLVPAESTVDGYIVSQRAVPVPASSKFYGRVQHAVVVIAWYNFELLHVGATIREKLAMAFENEIAWLKDIAAGRFSILDDDGEGPSTENGVSLDTSSDDGVFTDDSIGDYF